MLRALAMLKYASSGFGAILAQFWMPVRGERQVLTTSDQPFLLDHATHHAQAQRTHRHNSQRTAYREKSEGKRGQSIQTIIFRSWSCCLSQTHLLSSKWRVQLHGGAAIGGVAAPELVWWSWSSPKHALSGSGVFGVEVFGRKKWSGAVLLDLELCGALPNTPL
jgi:hypothetical protein